ncbi:hypothetical protein QFW96_03650 [Saccharopolyspora sp. TS4A08]|uniref:SbsA Ig-like domain-containing protein n=1 Tax=Saccharopolyspora ipomoeae TaxID=3042027 RepID=A0ABT6PIA3_9PSEU|nr:hypothetical protein [Saccharopolyspora sp. TS4A08]MDI2027684.1 hypothetical protein [Saccharopolyspora sp. TS4A08]
MSNSNRARSERTRRTAAIIAAAGASGVLIAMGGTGVLAQGPPPPPPAPPAPPSPAPPSPPPLEEQPPGGQAPGQNEGRGDQKLGGIDTGMTVESADPVSVDLDDNAPEKVEYRFAEPVSDVGDPSSFQLSGFNTNASVKAQTAKIKEGDTRTVLTEYAPGTDVNAYTVAITDSQAVQNESGRTNLPNTVELQGNQQNRVSGTDAPRLTDRSHKDDTLDQVTYVFDRKLKEDGGADASKFGLYTKDGRAITGQSIVTTNDETITVQFDSQVEDGVKQFAKADAVSDTRGVKNAPSAVGDDTTGPNLSSTSGLIGKTQFDYTFDEPVTAKDAEKFVIYTADGKAIHGDSVVQPSPETIRVAYPEIQDYGDQISLAAVDEDAAESSDGSATPNAVGDQSVGGDRSGSLTSGPDLTGASVDSETGQVRLDFDEPIDDSKTYDKAGFQLVTTAGDRIDAKDVVEIDGSSVLVSFNRASAEAASSVTVNNNAVQDEQGNGNLLANKALGEGNGQPSGQLNDQNQSNLNDNRSDLNNNNDNNRSDLNDNQSDNNNQDRQDDLDNGSSNNGPN